MTSSKFFEEGLFTRQRYHAMKDQKARPGLTCNMGFAKEKGLQPKFKRFSKLSTLGDVVSKPVQSKRITDGCLGAAAEQFF